MITDNSKKRLALASGPVTAGQGWSRPVWAADLVMREDFHLPGGKGRVKNRGVGDS
jgi:hypothetical protein